MSKSLVLLAVTLAILAQAGHAQVVRNGPLPAPLPLFPRTNWWNVDISAAPVDPNSASFIAFIGGSRGMHPDFGGDAGGTEIYGMPYIVVSGTQPLVPVTFEYDDESDAGAPGRPPGYPIPSEAITQGKWIEGGYSGSAGTSGDRHMLIVDRDNRLLFELWATRYNTTLSRWEAGSGAVFSLDSNKRRPEEWTSADAAGLAILPGLVRYDEAFGAEPIKHALRVTVRDTNGYVFPASHVAGDGAGALPMGARLRLKGSKDISGYPPSVQRIFQAMKDYGLIVADNGSDMYVSGMYDTRWDNGVLNPAFDDLTASDFDVIQLGWRPAVDFNSDGRNDLVWRNTASGSNAVWLMNGTALGSVANLPALSNTAYAIQATGDFDRDGKTDIVLRNRTSGQNAIWRMNGTQLIGISDLPALANPAYQFHGTADFDADGRTDLILRNGTTGQNALWLLNGTSLKAIADLPALPNPSYVIAGTGDFNFDGEPDLVLRNKQSGQNALWLMRRTTLLQIRDLPALPNSAYVIGGVADINGDFSPDILWRNESNGRNAAWLMNGHTLIGIVDLPGLVTTWTMGGPR